MENNCPRNCNECPKHNHCDSAFGNLGCAYREQIAALGKKKRNNEA